jgi:RNA polymerase sigma factor (sigma-70 family)
MARHDPLADPEDAVRRVYAYVAYRLGHGHDAEDVTSKVIERAIMYRASYDQGRGNAIGWLIGIARTCVDDALRSRAQTAGELDESMAADTDVEGETVRKLAVTEAVATLDPRERELVALRYGADLSTREIAGLLDMTTNAVDVALHRSRNRLRDALESAGLAPRQNIRLGPPATRTSP